MLFCNLPKEYDIKAFLEGTGEDDFGRTYNDILNYSERELEQKHNYIQRIFPTNTLSMYSPCIILSEEEAKQMTNDKIKKNMIKAYEKMMCFYGFNPRNDDKIKKWVYTGSHNYKRITRIIISLSIFGLQKETEELMNYLSELYSNYPKQIGNKTFSYWENAYKEYISFT